MRKETKENIQYSTAVGMLVLGASLSVAGFVCSEPIGRYMIVCYGCSPNACCMQVVFLG